MALHALPLLKTVRPGVKNEHKVGLVFNTAVQSVSSISLLLTQPSSSVADLTMISTENTGELSYQQMQHSLHVNRHVQPTTNGHFRQGQDSEPSGLPRYHTDIRNIYNSGIYRADIE